MAFETDLPRAMAPYTHVGHDGDMVRSAYTLRPDDATGIRRTS
jgi:hypothetical protein